MIMLHMHIDCEVQVHFLVPSSRYYLPFEHTVAGDNSRLGEIAMNLRIE